MSRERNRDGGATLAALLEPHRESLEAAARGREAAARAAKQAAERPLRRLDEGQLMKLIFAHLDDDNPRVCEGIDFERLTIIERAPAEPAPTPEPPRERGEDHADAAPDDDAKIDADRPALAASEWVGASWSDDLGPRVEGPELAERPELDEAGRRLLRRARRIRDLSELDLHGFDRRRALRHLELFVGLCRGRGDRYCRVITGKGVSSVDAPVLKQVVVRWCEASPPRPSGRAWVSAWTPEPDQYGEWGALILQLRRPR